jgi:hypothetical protein
MDGTCGSPNAIVKIRDLHVSVGDEQWRTMADNLQKAEAATMFWFECNFPLLLWEFVCLDPGPLAEERPAVEFAIELMSCLDRTRAKIL